MHTLRRSASAYMCRISNHLLERCRQRVREEAKRRQRQLRTGASNVRVLEHDVYDVWTQAMARQLDLGFSESRSE